jgi:cysteinylglycine-S-conjugate dipeptidase
MPQEAALHPATADALRRRVDAGFNTALAELKTLTAIPGIAWDAFDPVQLEHSAEAVAAFLRGAGVDDVRIIRESTPDGIPGAPAVLARKPAAPGAPTVLLYAHHDVQPPGERKLWDSDPFDAVEHSGRLWGRGVADNKAGAVLHIAAFRALAQVLGDRPGVGVTFLIEGEEESGSPTFPAILERYREELHADVVVVADSGNWQVGVPALTTSLRGLIDGTIEVRALSHGLHSGTYGGPSLDALTLLARLVATFHDDDGTVTIGGLAAADGAAVDMEEDRYRADAGMPANVRLAGTGSIVSRLWTKPAMAIIGVDAPAVAVSSNTLVPSARARFSLRLAPGTDPRAAMEAVRRHVQQHAPFGAEVVFTSGQFSKPYAADPGSAAARGMLWAMEQAWGTKPVTMGAGGSIPAVSELAAFLPEADILITGAEDPDSRAHGANESVHLEDFRRAILAEALLLAGMDPGASTVPGP